MLDQLHVRNHLGLKQADGVAGDRVAETGMKFFGNSRAADDIAAFDKADLQAGAREIKGANKAVMASTDDDGVIFLGHFLLQPDAGRCSRRASGMMLRTWRQKLFRHTSLSDSGPIEKLRLAMPCCTRVTRTVSSALT